jgi:hypothetical protein
MKPITFLAVGTAAFIASCACGIFGNDGYRFAKDYWGKRLGSCGSSYVAYNPNPGLVPFSIIECKDPTFFASESSLNEADKLNGFEWVGQTGFTCSSMRFKPNMKSSPSRWMSNINIANYRTWKKNGKWEVQQPAFSNLVTEPGCTLLK